MRRSPGSEAVKTLCYRVAARYALPATVSLTIEGVASVLALSPILPGPFPPRERGRGRGKVRRLGRRCGGYHPPFLSPSGGEEGGQGEGEGGQACAAAQALKGSNPVPSSVSGLHPWGLPETRDVLSHEAGDVRLDTYLHQGVFGVLLGTRLRIIVAVVPSRLRDNLRPRTACTWTGGAHTSGTMAAINSRNRRCRSSVSVLTRASAICRTAPACVTTVRVTSGATMSEMS